MTVRFTPLGGVGTFGRNCLLVEDEASGQAIIVDCGVRFVADEAPGYDLGLPDIARIGALGDRLLGYVVTHGHEDHIGALPHAHARNPAQIIATPFTAKLIAARFARTGAPAVAVDVVQLGESRTLGPFTSTWLAVSHSIPDASCVAVRTPAGVFVHSGDFRVDDDPVIGVQTDLDALTALGDEGIALLLADSTGAVSPGRNPGEKSVVPALRALFDDAPARIVVALFASHVARAALIFDECRRTGRKACLLGRGLEDALAAAQDLRIVDGRDVLVDEGAAHALPRDRVCYLATGSQGEPRAGLARLADGTSSTRLDPGDRVVVSARVIPGAEKRVARLLDLFAEQRVTVVDASRGFHVSGHGHQGDLELLLHATRPRFFAALHGGARHLVAHDALVRRAGLDAERVVDLRDGHALVLHEDGTMAHVPAPRAAEPYARDLAVDEDPLPTVFRRRRMADGGVVIVVVDVDGPRLIAHAMAGGMEQLVKDARVEADRAWAKGGDDVDEALVRAVTKPFRRARVPPPEVILVGGPRGD